MRWKASQNAAGFLAKSGVLVVFREAEGQSGDAGRCCDGLRLPLRASERGPIRSGILGLISRMTW